MIYAIKTRSIAVCVLGTLMLGVLAHLALASQPVLKRADVDRIRELPHGVGTQVSLFVRSRHVESIHFEGAGTVSAYGYTFSGGLIPEGVWLRLSNAGDQPTSRAVVTLVSDTDASRYDSLVLWARAKIPQPKFTVHFQDRDWKNKNKIQSHSPVIHSEEWNEGEIWQVALPFSVFTGRRRIIDARLSIVGFDFGRDRLNNPNGEILEILGMAFVKQSSRLTQVAMVNLDAKVENLAVASPSPPAPKSSPKPPVVRDVKLPAAKPPIKVASPPPLDRDVTMELTPLLEKPATEQPLPQEFELENAAVFSEITEVKESPKWAALSKWEEFVFTRLTGASMRDRLIPLVISLLVGLMTGVLFWMIRKRKSRPLLGLPPLIHHLNWPLLSDEFGKFGHAEKMFWRRLHDRGITCAWLSPYQTTLEKFAADEHPGETFLRRQIKAAAQGGVRLFPSLCFVRSLFHFESFIAKPHLYYTKPIPPAELHLSDEELRIRYIGYFPVWIPPYWQKQHGLPQKLLLAYGKLPGTLASSDSIQFNLRSPELRKLAIRVIDRIAEVGSGVRIEGAVALLNSTLNMYWGGNEGELEPGKETEFWFEVIETTKLKHPDFLFIADGCGPYAQRLREIGFDYYENDHLMQILSNQIRIEEVGNLESVLSPEAAPFLNRSIYDTSPLFRGSPTGGLQRRKSLLASMIVGFLPGSIQHDGQIPQDLAKFFSLVSKWAPFREGKYVQLPTNSAEVLAYARWEKRVIFIVVANLGLEPKSAVVRMDPFGGSVDPSKLYLFNDALHGSALLTDLKSDVSQPPAIAVLGQDLRETGLNVTLTELSLRLFSVNLGAPIQHDIPSEIRQLHQA